MKAFVLAALAGLALWSAPAAAKAGPMLDCPLRDAPYSTASPLIDILLNPQAKAVVEARLPGMFAGLPPGMFGTTAPSFASIITLREVAAFRGKAVDGTEALDAALAAVPVTDADRVARCARYDDDRPKLVLPPGRPRILLFEKINGFRDGPSVEAAHAAFLAMAKRKGWAIVATDKGGAINAETLAQFDAVIWNNISGDVLTLTQRRAFQDFLKRGGGFVGIHGAAGDPASFWDWYVDDLIGARFAGHPIAKQFQDARVVLATPATEIITGLPTQWTMNDEWYSFKTNPRASGARVVATLDEGSYSPVGMGSQDLRMGDHPIVWTRCMGKGRVFYSAIGHRPETYADARYVTLLENALAWAGEGRVKGCE